MAIPLPVKIVSPQTGESFNGIASGTYFPTLNTPTIKYFFWKHVDDGTDPDDSTADLKGDGDCPDPVAGMWKVSFTLPAGSDTKGMLRVRKLDGTDPPYQARDLTWPVSGLTVRPMSASRAKGVAATPHVDIQKPASGDEVPRLFVAYGEFNSGDGNTVSVRLFRPDDSEAVATILPVEYPYGIQWVTATLSYEGGIGYRLEARLIDEDGEFVPPANSVGIAID